MEFIEKEERDFMGKQMEKSLRQISGELEVIIEGESLSAFLTIKEELEEKPHAHSAARRNASGSDFVLPRIRQRSALNGIMT